jgi:hypothetical protein
MEPSTIVMIAEVVQSLLLPLLAVMLAVQAVLMRHIMRWLFDLQMQVVQLTSIVTGNLVSEGDGIDGP